MRDVWCETLMILISWVDTQLIPCVRAGDRGLDGEPPPLVIMIM